MPKIFPKWEPLYPAAASERQDRSAPVSKEIAPPHRDGESGFGLANIPPADEIAPGEILRLLYRGKWIVLASVFVVMVAVGAYSHLVEPEYEASSLVLLHVPEQGDRSLREALAMTAGGVLARNDRSISNELAVLQNSPDIAENVADELHERRVTPGSGRPLPVLYDEFGEALPRSAVIDRVLHGVMSFVPDSREVDVIRMTARSADPEEAALIANVYARSYVQATRDASRERASASRDFLEQQEKTRREELQRIENDVKTYMSREGAVALDSEGQLLVRQISELEDARDRARIELQMQQASLRSLEEELSAIQPQLAERLASGVERDIEVAQEKMAELEVRRQQIFLRNPQLQQRPGGDEKLTEINDQIAQLRVKIERLSHQYVEEVMAVGGINLTVEGGGLAQVADLKRKVVDARIAISGLEAKVDVMDRRLAEHDTKLRVLPEQSIELAQMQRARASAERMYLNIVEKLQEVRIAEESESGYASVIREARPPGSPVRPRKDMNLLLGLALSLMLGVGLAFVKNAVDQKIHTPDALADDGITVLGVIPKMNQFIREEFDGDDVVERGGRRLSTRLVTTLAPASTAAEAYRQFRTNVFHSRSPIGTIVVTSPAPGDGKSVTAANLAVTSAQLGRRTLLIGADLRRPHVHEQFGMDRAPGLVEMLSSREVPDLAAHASGIPDLYVIPSGQTVSNPAEVIESHEMSALLAWLRERFDVIVLDTPPVLLATEGTVLATLCDATIVVANAGETERPDLDQCLATLRNTGGRVIGTVLNRFKPNVVDRYGSRYSYYGRYYSDAYAYEYS